MLIKYKDVRPKKDVKSLLKMFSCLQRIQEIFLVGVFYFRTVNTRIMYKNKIQYNWTARENGRSSKTINVVTCKGRIEDQEK